MVSKFFKELLPAFYKNSMDTLKMDEHSDYPNIVRQLNDEEVADSSAVGRIVTALIASFALLSFVFILWYAYAEGKKQGLAKIQQQNQVAATNAAPTTNTTPPTTNQSATNANSNANNSRLNPDLLASDQTRSLDAPKQFRPSFGNDFAQQVTSNSNDIPRDPTQPIPLSSPDKYKRSSEIPPPPSVTNEPQATQDNQEIIEAVAVPTNNSNNTVKGSIPKVATLDPPRVSSEELTKTASIPTPANDYGYIVGSDFSDQWRVQLASLRSVDSTNNYWKQKKDDFPSILGGFRLQIEKVAITGKGDFYRLRIGPFLSRAEATKTCGNLKEKKIDCFIVRPS